MNMKNLKIPLQVFSLAFVCCTLCACQVNNAENEIYGNYATDFEKSDLMWLGELRDDGWRCEGTCVNTDGITCNSFLARITSPDGSYSKEIALSAESLTMPTGEAHWEDINFDGKLDVLVHLGGGRGGIQGYAAILWNETVGDYLEEPAYAEIINPTPDPKCEIIWGGADSSFQFDLNAWEYLEGKLMQTHKLSIVYDFSSEKQGVSYAEYELKNGTMSIIQDLIITQDDFQDINTYVSEYAEWEGWEWCPISCFQQKG